MIQRLFMSVASAIAVYMAGVVITAEPSIFQWTQPERINLILFGFAALVVVNMVMFMFSDER